MPKIIVTAEVDDSTEWERRFRTHGKLLTAYTATAVDYSTTENNKVAICFDVQNLQTYLTQMESPETEAAMAHDGVKRETVKVVVLNKRLPM